MRNSSSFEQGVTFPYSGKVYTVEKELPEISNYNSLTPSLYEKYLISSEDQSYILKMVAMKTKNKQSSSFDEEDEEQILIEYNVLKLINKHPYTLKCFGKANLVDKYQCIRTSIILQSVSEVSLESYLENNLSKLDNQTIMKLCWSLIESFLSFEKENIIFNDELNISYFGVENDEILILNGFSYCEIHEKPLTQIEKESYIYKKNCAQIKAIVFALLLQNQDLLKKYVTPYNLQPALEKIISNNQEFQSLSSNFPQFSKICKEPNLTSLINFFFYANSVQENQRVLNNQFRNEDVLLTTQPSHMEKLMKLPTQMSKASLLSDGSDNTPGKSQIQLNIETIVDENEDDDHNNSSKQQIIYEQEISNNTIFDNKQSTYSQMSYNPPSQVQNQMKFQANNSKVSQKTVAFIEIELQENQKQSQQLQKQLSSLKKQETHEKTIQELPSNNNKINKNNDEYLQITPENNQNPQTRSSIQSQQSYASDSFRRKADKLKDEEIEEISSKIKHKQKQQGDFQRRKQQLKQAQNLEDLKKQNQQIDEESQRSEHSQSIVDKQNAKLENLADNLLFTKAPQNTSLISDANVIRIMIALLILFIAGGIIFGAVFNFGVDKQENDKPIVCLDKNCQTCSRYEDECTECKSDYQMDYYSQKCINKCETKNCDVCINDFKKCEKCADGYTIYNNTCIPISDSCPISNCSECSNLQCTKCDFSYRLYDKKCIKKCQSSVCIECDASEPSKCSKCEPPFVINLTTKKCE